MIYSPGRTSIYSVCVFVLIFLTSCDLVNNIGDTFDGIKKKIKGEETSEFITDQSGGIFQNDKIEIKVPADAFATPAVVNIVESDDTTAFGQYTNSPLIQLDEWPEYTNKPVRIAIKYNSPINGDPMVAIGKEMYAVSADSLAYGFEMINAIDSSGYLVFTLPANPYPLKSTENNIADLWFLMQLAVVNNYTKHTTTEGHFEITYPLDKQEGGLKTGQYFEKAYSKAHEIGFGFGNRTWPIKVTAKHIPKESDGITLGYYEYRIQNGQNISDEIIQSHLDKGIMVINTQIFGKDKDLMATCGHEFLHFVQNAYEFSSPTIEKEQAWLKEASSVWFEKIISGDPAYISNAFKGRETYPLKGWYYTAVNHGHSKHGYGDPMVVEGVAERYGNAAIVKIFEEIKKGTIPDFPTDPINALKSQLTQETLALFWHSVFGSYITGNYFSSVNNQLINLQTTYVDIVTIENNKTSYSDQKEYMDLSAKMYAFNGGNLTNYNKLGLMFTIDEPTDVGIMVLRYSPSNKKTTLIDEVFPGEGVRVVVSNAKEIFDSGDYIMCAVTNGANNEALNYKDKRQINLMVEEAVPTESYIEVDLLVDDIDYHVYYKKTDTYGDLNNVEKNINFYSYPESSTFVHNVFSSVWNGPEVLGRIFRGNMRVHFSEKLDKIDLSLSQTQYYSSFFGGDVVDHYELSVNSLQISNTYTHPDNGRLVREYRLDGSNVSRITFDHEYENDINRQNMTNYNCGSNAHLIIKFVE